MTDGQGRVIGRRDNLPFGDALRDVNEPGGDSAMMSAAESGSTTSGLWAWSNTIRVRYAGMEKDAATGLEHTPFRKYDSGWGRWTSPDPYPGSMSQTDPQSFNRYAYVQNDPVNFVDPSGLMTCGAEFSYSQCGGGGGFWGGGPFGGDVAVYDRYYGGMPSHMALGVQQYEQRVSNAQAGNGFRTGAEVEYFQMRYWEYEDGSVYIEPFSLSPMTINAGGLAWHEGSGLSFRLEGFANGVTGGFVNWVHRRMGRLDEAGQAWLESQSEYSSAENVGVVAGAIVPVPGPGKFSAAKALLGAWGKGTFPTIANSVRYHFAKHGAEVGAKDAWQYMRKAEAFGRNLRRARISDLGEGATRYTKNGYYIIKDSGGNILSFGRAR